MPSHSFSTQQSMSVVAYLRTAANAAPAPAAAGPAAAGAAAAGGGGAAEARGRTVFEGKGGCTGCHKVGATGGSSGPDLSAIAAPRTGRGFQPPPNAAMFEKALLEPDADVAVPYRTFQVVPKAGQPVRGALLNQDTFSIQMRDSAGELRAFQKSDVKESSFLPSPMPSYRGRLTPQELSDVVSYLLSLKG